MYTSPSPYIQSLLFDKGLIENGGWSSEDRKEIEEWNEETNYELQKIKAAQLISYLILKILSDDCSPSGKIRAKRLGSALSFLEQILISSRELEKKFYRDHLNHNIRVALLARAIATKAPFTLSSEELNDLVITSLFHDVGYPLSNIGQSLDSTIGAMKNCYNIASRISSIFNLRIDPNVEKLFSTLLIEPSIVSEQLSKLDHGLVSSLEFISYLKQDEECLKRYAKVIRAIAFHSPSFNFPVDALTDKLLTILILADELQDWGRPIHLSVIPKITNFKLRDNILSGEIDAKEIPSYSVLRQVSGKSGNLFRLMLPKGYSFELQFPIKKFNLINLSDFEWNLQLLYNKCIELEESMFYPSIFPKLYEEDSTFEKIFYGTLISKETKLELLNLLENNKLIKYSPFIRFNAFINKYINELLLTSKKINNIKKFSFFSSRDGTINLKLVCNSDNYEGIIKTIRSTEVYNIAMLFLSEVRFFNISIQKISNYLDEPYPVDMGIEGFPNKIDVKKVSNSIKEFISFKFFELLFPIRECINNEGIFLFKNKS